jgi:hypothetical protein
MTVSVNGTTGITFNDASIQNTAATGFGFKNRIINGQMVLDQRNAGASITPLDAYTLDRWQGAASAASKYTVQQNAGSVTPPVGFSNYLGVTSLSSYSVPSAEDFAIRQSVEGFNAADLGWGTASASPITLSFWVRSSLTGTFGGSLTNNAFNRSYPFSYTISAANTWEQKFLTIAGDTTGTWLTNNGVGIRVSFSLGTGATYQGTVNTWAGSALLSPTGATSIVGTNGATWYVTGIQFEKGTTATSFDYRPYGTELALCQRYYTKYFADGSYSQFALSTARGSDISEGIFPLPTPMRVAPTSLDFSTLLMSLFAGGGSSAVSSATINTSSNTRQCANVSFVTSANLGAAGACLQVLSNNSTSAFIGFGAEI